MYITIPPIPHETIIDSKFEITDSIPLSEKCFFGDSKWDFTDENNLRLNSVGNSKLRIDWKEWEEKTNKSITRDFKVICFVYIKCPSLISKKKLLKPHTVISTLKSVLSIFQQLIEASTIEIGDGKIYLVRDISDISIEEFESLSLSLPNQQNLKRLLSAFTNPSVSKFLSAKPAWNQADVKKLKLAIKPATNIQELSTKPLSDDFFTDLVKQATLDIIGFKKYFGMETHTKVPESYLKDLEDLFNVRDLRRAIEDYIKLRKFQRKKSIEHGKRGSYASNLNKEFFGVHGINVIEFNKKLSRIQRSAIFLFLQFTGVRYSDAVSFRKRCIVPKEKGIYVIKGSHIKNDDINLPSDIDEWVAVPIVRDSIEILELFQEFTFNSYLISGLFSVFLNVKDLPLSLNGVIDNLNLYVKELSETIENFQKYYKDANNHISIHRLRHTLALQFVRAELGIPYISFHLKHVHSAVHAYSGISNVTLGYGGIANEIFHSVPAIKQARGEFYEEIYNPNSPIAGGSYTEEFKKRRKEYFQGLMVNDEDIEDVIEDLKERFLPFVDVGLGYCGGRKDIVQMDGTKTPPPCIGQLKCNPIECGNSIIPKSKLPVWEKLHKENSDRLIDPEFSYAKEELQKIVEQSRSVIEHFRNEDKRRA